MTCLVSDVGGTNIRLAVAKNPHAPLQAVASMKCADFETIGDAIHGYIDGLDKVLADRISAVAIAVAGPVNADFVAITNNHWRFYKGDLLKALPAESLLVINDFTAQALAQSDPSAHGNRQVLEGKPDGAAPLLILGPGTGLGVSALIPNDKGFIPIEGEGGHVSFSPRSERERQLEAFMRQELDHVTAEHLLGGAGLESIYRFLAKDVGGLELQAPEIGQIALAEPGLCRDAATMFLGILGTVVADNILTFGCWRGAVIAGGMVPKLEPLIGLSPFADRVRTAGIAPALMAQIPVWLSVDPHAGLRGVQAALANAHLAPRRLDRTRRSA